MDVDGVLLDLGGTLIWPEPAAEMLFCEASQLIGFQVTPIDLLRVSAEVDQQIYVPLPISRNQEADFFAYGNMMVLRKLGFEATLSHGWFIYHYVVDRIHYHKFYDVDIVLSSLRAAGFCLALVSNAVPSTRDRIRSLGLEPYFDAILLSGEVGFEKPSPEIFLEALNNLDMIPTEVVHVGANYTSDVRGAQSAGIPAVLLDRTGRYLDVDCITVRNLTEFQELIHIQK